MKNKENLTSEGEAVRLGFIRRSDADERLGLLPTLYFNIIVGSERVGTCELRIGENERTRFIGNIGFTVFEPYRGHHYAAKAVRLLCELAWAESMEQLLVTYRRDNIASARSCESAGGEAMGIVTLPEDDILARRGKREILVYRFESSARS